MSGNSAETCSVDGKVSCCGIFGLSMVKYPSVGTEGVVVNGSSVGVCGVGV